MLRSGLVSPCRFPSRGCSFRGRAWPVPIRSNLFLYLWRYRLHGVSLFLRIPPGRGRNARPRTGRDQCLLLRREGRHGWAQSFLATDERRLPGGLLPGLLHTQLSDQDGIRLKIKKKINLFELQILFSIRLIFYQIRKKGGMQGGERAYQQNRRTCSCEGYV